MSVYQLPRYLHGSSNSPYWTNCYNGSWPGTAAWSKKPPPRLKQRRWYQPPNFGILQNQSINQSILLKNIQAFLNSSLVMASTWQLPRQTKFLGNKHLSHGTHILTTLKREKERESLIALIRIIRWNWSLRTNKQHQWIRYMRPDVGSQCVSAQGSCGYNGTRPCDMAL